MALSSITSTCFKRKFFEKFGKFDEQYQLIEDFPMHIRLARRAGLYIMKILWQLSIVMVE
jgi:hypothetical protein